MKVLIFGAKGKVGSALAAHLNEVGHEVISAGRAECDIIDQQALQDYLLAQGADAIVNCAAISGIEACLDDPVTCHMVNVMAPQTMARLSRQEGIKFIHISTDYVLDGRKPGLKNESTKCKPINTYGESKAEAEWRVLDENPDAIVARVS